MTAALHSYGGRALSRLGRSWPGIEVERGRWQVSGHATGLSRRTEHQLFVTLSGSIRRTTAWIDDGDRYDGAEFAGATTFIPSDRLRRSTYRDGVIDYAGIRLDPKLVEDFEEIETARLEFAGFTNRPDPMLRRLALALCEEAEQPGCAGNLYVDSVATALLVHLVRTSSNLSAPRLVDSGVPLSGSVLRRVLEYIEDNLADDLRLETLAGLTGTDRARFGRAFKSATGTSPHRYVLRRRLDRAAELLRAPAGPPIADIACRVGMSSQSHLTTAFRRAFGTTPHAYRMAHAIR